MSWSALGRDVRLVLLPRRAAQIRRDCVHWTLLLHAARTERGLLLKHWQSYLAKLTYCIPGGS